MSVKYLGSWRKQRSASATMSRTSCSDSGPDIRPLLRPFFDPLQPLPETIRATDREVTRDGSSALSARRQLAVSVGRLSAIKRDVAGITAGMLSPPVLGIGLLEHTQPNSYARPSHRCYSDQDKAAGQPPQSVKPAGIEQEISLSSNRP